MTHYKVAFPHAISLETAQFYGTGTKNNFGAIRLKPAYFKHRKGKTLSFVTQSSNQLKFAANKPKDVLVS